MPESRTASMPATRANWVKRSSRFVSLGVDIALDGPIGIEDLAAEADAIGRGVEPLDSGRTAALAVDRGEVQISSTRQPSEVTAPCR